jgi:O-antigen ligase
MKLCRIQNFSLYLFLFFVNFQELGINNISIPKISAFIYLIVILPQLSAFLSVKGIQIFILPVWLFFAILTLVSIFHINIMVFEFFDFQIFQLIILYWIILNHGRKRPGVFEKGMLALAFGSVLLSVFYFLGIGVEYGISGIFYNERVTLFGDNGNIIGIRMCISIVIISLAVFQNKLGLGKSRYLLLLFIPIMFLLLVETASRVAFIAFLLSIIVGIYFSPLKIWRKIVVVCIGGIITIIIIWPILIQNETLLYRILQTYVEGDMSNRKQIYSDLIPVIQKNPILGIGKTGYISLIGYGSPHNVLLEILCYTGIVGLIFYLTFISAIIFNAYQYIKKTNYLLPFLLLIPVLGLIASGQVLDQKLAWIIFAYIVSCSSKIRKQNIRVI